MRMIHASAKVAAVADASCADVLEEINARVKGQPATWHDPHNNGVYSFIKDDDDDGNTLKLKRLTGDRKYTDKLNLALEEKAAGKCTIRGCSESQVTSVADFGTNYCNLRMLYCAREDGCVPILHDFSTKETDVSTSSAAAQHDMKLCLKV